MKRNRPHSRITLALTSVGIMVAALLSGCTSDSPASSDSPGSADSSVSAGNSDTSSALVVDTPDGAVQGVVVGEGSVISMGVFIGASTKIIDRATGEVHVGRVPPYSVVVSGSLPGKPLPDGSAGPSLYCAVIVKRVDEKTRSKTSINELLRD